MCENNYSVISFDVFFFVSAQKIPISAERSIKLHHQLEIDKIKSLFSASKVSSCRELIQKAGKSSLTLLIGNIFNSCFNLGKHFHFNVPSHGFPGIIIVSAVEFQGQKHSC